jgi:8-oxo-dGTP pyrophosphatase MutT (NUDIX family)
MSAMTDLSKMANTIFPDPKRGPFRVGVIAFDREGNCLALLRSDTQHFPRTWGTPGGKIKPGETPTQAVIREFREETGGDLISLTPIFCEEQNKLKFLTYLGLCAGQFTPVLNEEHISFRWQPFSDWPKPASPGMQSIIDHEQLPEIIRQYDETNRSGPVTKPSPENNRP